MAFWIASPLMDPEMFVLTAAIIDVPFALARALSALALGLVAGCSTHLLRARPWAARPLDPGFDPARAGSVWSARCEAPAGGAADPVVWAFWRVPERRAVFAAQCRAIGWFLLRWLTLAFLVESLMVAYIPAGSVARLLGGGDWWAVPVSAAVGIPAYLNGYAAIPAVSALLDMGMRPGAALAFMTAGEVTSIPTALSVFVIVRRPVFALYLGLGLLGALPRRVRLRGVADAVGRRSVAGFSVPVLFPFPLRPARPPPPPPSHKAPPRRFHRAEVSRNVKVNTCRIS